MRNRFIAVFITCVFVIGIAVGVFASSPIRILINGVEVKSDVSPQIIKGRTMVPLRTISEGLGAEVKWDSKKQEVQINSWEDVWDEPFDPWGLGEEYDAVCVVSKFLALLQGSVDGANSSLWDSYPEIFSKSVIESVEPWMRVWHPAMSGVGSSVRRFSYKILDGRVAGKDKNGAPVYEIAARLDYYDPIAGDPVLTEWIKVYTVISETYTGEYGGSNIHLVINGEKTLKETKLNRTQMPSFWD